MPSLSLVVGLEPVPRAMALLLVSAQEMVLTLEVASFVGPKVLNSLVSANLK